MFVVQLGGALGVESHVLGPEETGRLYPLMNVDDVYGSLYSPADGTVSPHGYCTGLVRAATRLGAKVLAYVRQYVCFISASLSTSIASGARMVQNIRLAHLSVRKCELWQNGRLDPDAVWGGERGRSRDGCIGWGW